jgi:hypothetical protein
LYPICPPFTEQTLSDHLIELSSSFKRHDTRERKPTTPVLFVVGTPIVQHQDLLSYEQNQSRIHNPTKSPKDVWTAITNITVSDFLQFIQWISRFSLHYSIQMVSYIQNVFYHGWKYIRTGRSNHYSDNHTHQE